MSRCSSAYNWAMSPDTRPVLIGMNNPISLAPEHALYPWPLGCAGHRLYAMLLEVRPATTMSAYARAFDRRNLVRGPWDLEAARVAAVVLRGALFGRRVVLLGREVARAFGIGHPVACGKVTDPDHIITFYFLPHPSGRNPHYNKPENRLAAGRLLCQLLDEEGA
jgi:hypothetical protein